jgi:hypothetical protein
MSNKKFVYKKVPCKKYSNEKHSMQKIVTRKMFVATNTTQHFACKKKTQRKCSVQKTVPSNSDKILIFCEKQLLLTQKFQIAITFVDKIQSFEPRSNNSKQKTCP